MLYGKLGGELTFENLYLVGGGNGRDGGVREKKREAHFSNVSCIVVLCGKLGSGLAFENLLVVSGRNGGDGGVGGKQKRCNISIVSCIVVCCGKLGSRLASGIFMQRAVGMEGTVV